jgi:MinD superfamily P-loop ATPase
MKEIVIISGKGGTGKTSFCAALAQHLQDDLVVADCDVDAADLHLIFEPHNSLATDFYSGVLAHIDPLRCIDCGICAEKCRFDAISNASGQYTVDAVDCEGCGYCYHLCPENAISLKEQMVGQYMSSETRFECTLVHARLRVGADNSGKLVAKVKAIAKDTAKDQGKSYLIVDGSPGIGCPVIASLSGADYVILVTEASQSGVSDLRRIWELVKMFQIPGALIINKADINPTVTKQLHSFAKKEKILLLPEISYSDDFPKAISMGQSILETNPARWQPVISEIWKAIKERI